MIRSLCEYYDILSTDEDLRLSPLGFEMNTASYCAILTKEGELFDIVSLLVDKKRQAFMTPYSMKIKGIAASPVFDNFAYIFGVGNTLGSLEEKKFEKAKELHLTLFQNGSSDEAKAICRFFENWDIQSAWENKYILNQYSPKGNAFSGNVIFKLVGSDTYFHECEEIIRIWVDENTRKRMKEDPLLSQCSTYGEQMVIAKLHKQLSGVKGASGMGASLVCFNKDADSSYNLEQSYNAFVSDAAMHKYTTVLQRMLDSDKQKIFIGDDTTVFWASTTSMKEIEVVRSLFDYEEDEDDEDSMGSEAAPRGSDSSSAQAGHQLTKQDTKTEEIVRTLLKIGMQGIYSFPEFSPNVNFFVLGLAPNAGRISVRYFYKNSFIGFCEKIKQHYDDIKIYGGENGKEHIKISSLLYATVSPQSRDKKIHPLLGGAVMRALLTGERYPALLFNLILTRVKKDQSVSQAKAAAIKGYLLRNSRINKRRTEEISVYLNEDSKVPAYILGRVFAILEMIQQNAQGNMLNTTIKDRYFASACSTPALVFPQLLKLAQHHLAKIDGDYWSIVLSDCLSKYEGDSFPKTFDMENQGRFILGYYQQTQKLYEKRAKEGTKSVGSSDSSDPPESIESNSEIWIQEQL